MKSERKTKNRMKGDNTILLILIVMLVAMATFAGISHGYKLGIKNCNIHYDEYIGRYCICLVPQTNYQDEGFIPPSILNLNISIND